VSTPHSNHLIHRNRAEIFVIFSSFLGVAADCPDEDLIECVSLFIPQLLEIQSFINRCHIVIEQVERQIEAFYTAPNLGFETKGVHLKVDVCNLAIKF